MKRKVFTLLFGMILGAALFGNAPVVAAGIVAGR